ncbi:MAG: glycosyltransferase [Actinomycetes bacterium]
MALELPAGATTPDALPPHPRTAVVTAVIAVPERCGDEGDGDDVAPVLRAVVTQTRSADHVVGIAGEGPAYDRLAKLLQHTTRGEGRAGDAELVESALAQVPGEATGDDDEWLWLLTPAAVPAPQALENLLATVEAAPSLAIAGCKQVDEQGVALRDAGFTTTRFGRPVTGVDDGEVDQGQLDGRQDVLAVNRAGMLIRRSVFEQLDGTDPALGPAAGALDLCRRAWLAGHRVVVVPAALVRRTVSDRIGRSDAVHLRLTHCPTALLPLVAVGVLVGAFGRLLAGAATRSVGTGWAGLVESVRPLLHPRAVWRSRRRAERTRRLPRRSLAPLLAGPRETARWHLERWYDRRASGDTADTGGIGDAASPAAPSAPGPLGGARARGSRRVALLLVLALFAASVAALHRLLGPGDVAGGALAAPPASLAGLWRSLRSGWRAVGLGEAAAADPFGYVVAGASVLSGGSPRLAVVGLVLTAVPLAGLGAWLASGRATRSRVVRAWACLTWCAVPPLLLGVATGRLAAVVAHVAIPYVVWGVAACVQSPVRARAWTPAALAGVALAVVVASAPPLLLPAALALALVGATYPSRLLPLGWTLVPSLALLGPWILSAASSPRAFLADPSLPFPSPGGGWLDRFVGAGLPALAPSVLGVDGRVLLLATLALAVVLALVALLRRGPGGVPVRIGWSVAALGLLCAVVTGQVVVGTDGTSAVTGWPGTGISLATAGLLVAVCAAARGSRARLPTGRRAVARAVRVGVACLCLLLPAAALLSWGWTGASGRTVTALARTPGSVLPEVARDAGTSGDATRAVVLRAIPDGAAASLVRGSGATLQDVSTVLAARAVTGVGSTPWAQVQPAPPDRADHALDLAVATLVAGRTDPRPLLRDLGVGYVVLLPGDGARSLAAALGSLPGLAPSGAADGARVWQVLPPTGQGASSTDRPSASRLLNRSGRQLDVVQSVPLGAATTVPPAAQNESRRLVLSERRDDGWSATLDGRRLRPSTSGGWAQAFDVPAEGGRLVVEHHTGGQRVVAGLQVAVAALTLLLLVPAPRRRRHPGDRGEP